MSKLGIGSAIEFKDANFDTYRGVVYDNKDIILLGVGKFVGQDTVVGVKGLDVNDNGLIDLSNLIKKRALYDDKLIKGREVVDIRKNRVRECLYKNYGDIKDKTTIMNETGENIRRDFSRLKVGDVRRFVSSYDGVKATSELGIVVDDFYVYLLDGSVENMNVEFIGYKNVRLSEDIRGRLDIISKELRCINKVSSHNMKLNELCMDLEFDITNLAKCVNI